MSAANRRRRFSTVLRTSGGLVTVGDAAEALNVDRATAAKTLARWHKQGWLKRLRRGLYAPVPLSSSPEDQVLEDPWTLMPLLFEPGYIGGVSAAQHWDLTEQVFRPVFVYTARPVRRRSQTIHGIPYVVRHLAAKEIFGTRVVWRGRVKLQISDIHRTIVDMFDDPAAGGGIRHVADCLRAYLCREDADCEKLVAYADRIGNGAVFKRLGFITERLRGPDTLISACARRLTKGNARLDPALPSPRLIGRWRIWVPERWRSQNTDD